MVVLDSNQPKPVFVKKQGENDTKKVRLEVGDIWIKKNSDTVHATRADIEAMFNVRIEEEAEDRARKRLKHLQELGVPSSALGALARSSPRTAAPNFELLVGPRSDLRAYAEQLIATANFRPLRMLLELARETLEQGWDKLSARGPGLLDDITKVAEQLRNFYTNEFLPSLEAVVELGLLIVKHNGEVSWLASVIDLLLETFEAARNLQRLKSGRVIRDDDPLRWWRPGFDTYIGIRAIAIYAFLRKRLLFLGTILPRIVTIMTVDDLATEKAPILFWPFRSVEFQEFRGGRAESFWKERIGAAWGGYFGTADHFLRASTQLEFLLEFNSYVGTNAAPDKKVQTWIRQYLDPHLSFGYAPDLYVKDFEATDPIAKQIYDVLVAEERFPPYLAVDATMIDVLFYGKKPHERLSIYGDFLLSLIRWQANFRMQVFSRFGFSWICPGSLGELVKQAKDRAEKARLDKK